MLKPSITGMLQATLLTCIHGSADNDLLASYFSQPTFYVPRFTGQIFRARFWVDFFQLATFYTSLLQSATIKSTCIFFRLEFAHFPFRGSNNLFLVHLSTQHLTPALSTMISSMGLWPLWRTLQAAGDHASSQQKREEVSSCSPIGQSTSGFFHHRGFRSCKSMS